MSGRLGWPKSELETGEPMFQAFLESCCPACRRHETQVHPSDPRKTNKGPYPAPPATASSAGLKSKSPKNPGMLVATDAMGFGPESTSRMYTPGVW